MISIELVVSKYAQIVCIELMKMCAKPNIVLIRVRLETAVCTICPAKSFNVVL